jgi:hypothetical protein
MMRSLVRMLRWLLLKTSRAFARYVCVGVGVGVFCGCNNNNYYYCCCCCYFY